MQVLTWGLTGLAVVSGLLQLFSTGGDVWWTLLTFAAPLGLLVGLVALVVVSWRSGRWPKAGMALVALVAAGAFGTGILVHSWASPAVAAGPPPPVSTLDATPGPSSTGGGTPPPDNVVYDGVVSLRNAGFDLDQAGPAHIPEDAANLTDVDVNFNGDQLDVAKDAGVALWTKADSPSAYACRRQVDVAGLSETEHLIEAPRAGTAYCIVTVNNRAGFLVVGDRSSGTLKVHLTLWR